MSPEMVINIIVSILVLISSKVVATVWDEVKILRKAKHRHAQMIQRLEGGLYEVRDKLDLDPLPPIVETE